MLDSNALRTLLRRAPLLFIDAGARGDLEGGWRDFAPGCLSVLAFEPDRGAVIDWDDTAPLRHLERSALWSSEGEVDIHVGKIPSTSSVWPPDALYLERFADRFGDSRKTQSTMRVKARPLDNVLTQRGISADFLKIDTQGAELQILQGATDSLANSIIAAVIETWVAPIHKGQGLTHDVMALMYQKGFIVCQIETAAAWERKIVDRTNVSCRRQIVGLDILFMRDPQTIKERFGSLTYTAKFVAIAQMYGHYDLALEAITLASAQAGENKELLEELRQDLLKDYQATTTAPAPPASRNLLKRIYDKLRPKPQQLRNSHTKLHY